MASTTLQLFIGQTGSELARGACVVISIHKLLRIQKRMKGTGSELARGACVVISIHKLLRIQERMKRTGSEVKRGARVVKAYTSSSEVRNLFSEDRG